MGTPSGNEDGISGTLVHAVAGDIVFVVQSLEQLVVEIVKLVMDRVAAVLMPVPEARTQEFADRIRVARVEDIPHRATLAPVDATGCKVHYVDCVSHVHVQLGRAFATGVLRGRLDIVSARVAAGYGTLTYALYIFGPRSGPTALAGKCEDMLSTPSRRA